MDVHIGELTTEIDVTGRDGLDDAALQRIVRAVLAFIEAREAAKRRAARDRAIASPDRDDLEKYG